MTAGEPGEMTGPAAAPAPNTPLRVANPTPVQPAYRRLALFGGWLLRRLTKQDWDDAAGLPRTGGVILVSNHISNFDPAVLCHYVVWRGRWLRALGKSDLWQVPIIGRLARSTGQIPVYRGTDRAKDALGDAEAALAAGELILIYPEGTITADPLGWPMLARPGAARLALRTGCPVIPVGQWGANFVMPGKKPVWPRFWPRRTMVMRCGEPVELTDLLGKVDSVSVNQAGARIMAAITQQVAIARGEEPPADVYDIRRGERVPRPTVD